MSSQVRQTEMKGRRWESGGWGGYRVEEERGGGHLHRQTTPRDYPYMEMNPEEPELPLNKKEEERKKLTEKKEEEKNKRKKKTMKIKKERKNKETIEKKEARKNEI